MKRFNAFLRALLAGALLVAAFPVVLYTWGRFGDLESVENLIGLVNGAVVASALLGSAGYLGWSAAKVGGGQKPPRGTWALAAVLGGAAAFLAWVFSWIFY